MKGKERLRKAFGKICKNSGLRKHKKYDEPKDYQLELGYMIHANTLRGRQHMMDLLVMADEANEQYVEDFKDKNAYSIDFIFVRKAIGDVMTAMDALDDAHSKAGQLMTKKLKIRPIQTEDWVDDNGNPLGVGNR